MTTESIEEHATFQTRDGTLRLQLGQDIELFFDDPDSDEGQRVAIGPVTHLRPYENAAWIRGVRVDMETASLHAS